MKNFKNPIKDVWKLLGLAWQVDRKITIAYYLSSSVGALGPFISSYILMLIIDNLQVTQSALVPKIPVIIIVVLAARYIVSFFVNINSEFHRRYLHFSFTRKFQNELKYKAYKKISALDIAYFEKPETQDLISKTDDAIHGRLTGSLGNLGFLLGDLVGFLAAFIVLIPYGWWIPFLLSIMTIPRIYIQSKQSKLEWKVWDYSTPEARKAGYLSYILKDALSVREIRLSGSAETLLGKLVYFQDVIFKEVLKALSSCMRLAIIPPLIEISLLFVISYCFLPEVTSGVMTIGSFVLLINMLEQLGNRASAATSNFTHLYECNLYTKYFFELLSLPSLIHQKENPSTLEGVVSPKIEFRNVSFCYPSGTKVLNNVSFIIESGESVAFVGHNGAGKSTIIKLLCRFYDVSEGEILINGKNIKDLSLSQWHSLLGTLFQEFVQYSFTVRENIELNDPDKKDEELMRSAAIKSGAADFIEKLPKKYDQQLGTQFEDGVDLSGGEWQKIAIARAFYHSPPILILDEPTSAIDAEGEYKIFNNIEKQYKDKTLILVSHRFSTVRNANKIIVIGDGTVMESGSHSALMQLKGEYAKFFSLQARGYQ